MIKKFRWLLWKARTILASQLSNYPFISGKNFADECELVITSKTIKHKSISKEIEKSASIFVEGHLFYNFVDTFKEILGGKVIISGNSDANITQKPEFSNYPSALFIQNSTIPSDDVFKTIPIGLENISHARSGFKFQHKEVKKFEILDRILLPPMSPTNQVRKSILDESSKLEIFDVQSGFRSTSAYFKLVRRYKFIFVCEGNGFDTHRLWEVLYQNSFPVILDTAWARSLSWLNLPILTVSKLENLNKTLLELHLQKYSNNRPKDYPQLWMPFWEELIQSKTKSGN